METVFIGKSTTRNLSHLLADRRDLNLNKPGIFMRSPLVGNHDIIKVSQVYHGFNIIWVEAKSFKVTASGFLQLRWDNPIRKLE